MIRTGGKLSMKTCLVALVLCPLVPKSPVKVSDLVSPLRASTMLLTSTAPISNCRGRYGSKVMEVLDPETRSSDLSCPPKIFVIGESALVSPEDLVTAALCLGPTSSHPPSASCAVACVGDDTSEAVAEGGSD